MALPNPYFRGPLSEDEFKLIETGEATEAATNGYKVRVERVEAGGKLFARVTYEA